MQTNDANWIWEQEEQETGQVASASFFFIAHKMIWCVCPWAVAFAFAAAADDDDDDDDDDGCGANTAVDNV